MSKKIIPINKKEQLNNRIKKMEPLGPPAGGLGGVAKIIKKRSLTESIETIFIVNEFLITTIRIDLS